MEDEQTLFHSTVDTPSFKDRLLDLVREGKIKYTENYVKKLTEKTSEKIYMEFERKQLDEANTQLMDILSRNFLNSSLS